MSTTRQKSISEIPAGKVAVELYLPNGMTPKVLYRNVVAMDETFGFDVDVEGAHWHVEAIVTADQQAGALQLIGEAVAAGKAPVKIAQSAPDSLQYPLLFPQGNDSGVNKMPAFIQLPTRDADKNQALFFGKKGVKPIGDVSQANISVNVLQKNESARVVVRKIVQENKKTLQGEEFLCDKPINVVMSGVSTKTILQMVGEECGAKVTFTENAVRFSK